MFGFGNKKSQAEQDRETAIEQAKASLRHFVHDMVDLAPEECERKGKQLKDWCKNDKLVPFDFKQKALKRAHELECAANMRHCDMFLHEATEAAVAADNKEKGRNLTEARRYFGKACTLGADAEWKKAFQRAEETVLLTGGAKQGPSRAKPADLAPRAPNRAKA
jgi:nitrate reductase assembly molybdenum cofactor insertion protein NarJ